MYQRSTGVMDSKNYWWRLDFVKRSSPQILVVTITSRPAACTKWLSELRKKRANQEIVAPLLLFCMTLDDIKLSPGHERKDRAVTFAMTSICSWRGYYPGYLHPQFIEISFQGTDSVVSSATEECAFRARSCALRLLALHAPLLMEAGRAMYDEWAATLNMSGEGITQINIAQSLLQKAALADTDEYMQR